MTHSEHSAERVVRVERSQHHFSLLRTANGDYLGTANGVKLATFDHVDDKAIWRRLANANGYRHEITGVRINTAPEHDESRTPLREQNANSFVHNGDLFVPEHGPDQLPCAYLDTLRNNGWVCLPAILDPLTVAALERVSCTGPWSGNVFDDCTPSLNQDPVVAKTIAEPVSLWLIRQYLRTNDIRLAHPPTIRVIDTDDGQRNV